MLQKLCQTLRNKKIENSQIILVILAGILFVIISLPTREQKATKGLLSNPKELAKSSAENEEQVADYVEAWERKLEQILSQVKGAGKVQVILRLYQSDEQIIAEIEPTYGKEPYVVKTMEPVFSGAILVAEGAGNPTVYKELLKAVSSFLHLPVQNITILPMEANTKY